MTRFLNTLQRPGINPGRAGRGGLFREAGEKGMGMCAAPLSLITLIQDVSVPS